MTQRGNPNWGKGISGNPGGRPKDKPFTEALMRALKMPEAEDLALPRDKGRWLDRVARKVVKAAADGDMNAARLISDRTDGKPKQETDVNLNHGMSAGFYAALQAANAPRSLPDLGAGVIDVTPEKA